MQETGFTKPENIQQSENKFCQFSQCTKCLILILTLNSFQWMQWLMTWFLQNWIVSDILYFTIPSLLVLILTKVLGVILWPICPMVLIPRSGGHFIHKPLSMLLTGPGPVNSNQRPLATCLTGLSWFRKLFLLVASSHSWSYAITIIDLIELYIWSFQVILFLSEAQSLIF